MPYHVSEIIQSRMWLKSMMEILDVNTLEDVCKAIINKPQIHTYKQLEWAKETLLDIKTTGVNVP